MTKELDERQIGRLRLQAQFLVGSSFSKPAEAVRHMLAMQGQDFGAVQWGIGSRVPNSTIASVLDAFDSGELIRSWPMRGTLHVIAPEDIRWMLQLTWPRQFKSIAARHRQLDLGTADFVRAENIAIEFLRGGGRATRAEFVAELDAKGVSTDGQRGVHLISHLAQECVLVWGPMKGKDQALVLHDEWVQGSRALERDEALGEFVLRYFTSHGPATIKDFAWWSKMTLTDARIGLAVAREHLTELRCNDETLWIATATLARCKPDLAAAKESVLLLTAFDEFILGYQDRTHVLAKEYFELIVPGMNGVFKPTVVVGGEVVGTWKRTTTRQGTTVETFGFETLSANTGTLCARAANEYIRFRG